VTDLRHQGAGGARGPEADRYARQSRNGETPARHHWLRFPFRYRHRSGGSRPYQRVERRAHVAEGQASPGSAVAALKLPITGIVGGADLIDLNNLARIDLYRGSLQANQGLGFSSAAGQLDQIMLAPKQEFGGTISQGAGSDGF
jgi:hypothetical protein